MIYTSIKCVAFETYTWIGLAITDQACITLVVYGLTLKVHVWYPYESRPRSATLHFFYLLFQFAVAFKAPHVAAKAWTCCLRLVARKWINQTCLEPYNTGQYHTACELHAHWVTSTTSAVNSASCQHFLLGVRHSGISSMRRFAFFWSGDTSWAQVVGMRQYGPRFPVDPPKKTPRSKQPEFPSILYGGQRRE